MRLGDRWVLPLAVALCAVILAIDTRLRLGVAGGVPYLLPVLCSIWYRSRWAVWAVASLATVLVIIGWALSPEGAATWQVAANRGMAIFAIWTTAIGLDLYSKTALSLKREHEEKMEALQKLRDREALAQLGEMAAVIAHEVRNPLAGISATIQILVRRLELDPTERRLLEGIPKRIQSLEESLTSMLRYARLRDPNPEPASLRRIAEETVATIGTHPAAHDVTVTVSGDAPEVLADSGLVHEALLNILVNAAQAMEGTGRIEVKLTEEGDRACVQVEDDGPGIPEDIRDKVLKPFFTTRTRGTGLGLSVVNRIIGAHGGSLALATSSLGGARIRMELPRRAPRALELTGP